MLQFTPDSNSTYSIPEQVQMAIEGDCQWIHLSTDGVDDAVIREIGAEVVPLCRESGTILTIENRPELARELGIHGILITDKSLNPSLIRQSFGGDGIIGVASDSAAAIPALEAMDIDYAVLPKTMTSAEIRQLVDDIRKAGSHIHIVASGDYDSGNCSEVMDAGVSGVLTGARLMQAPDPVEAVQSLISTLSER